LEPSTTQKEYIIRCLVLSWNFGIVDVSLSQAVVSFRPLCETRWTARRFGAKKKKKKKKKKEKEKRKRKSTGGGLGWSSSQISWIQNNLEGWFELEKEREEKIPFFFTFSPF